MAKNKVRVDVEVTDKGSLKQVGNNAKEAAAGLDRAGKAAGTYDRNTKGAAQATSNSTKAFSKMAQGSGGIAGIYAQIAANVFAVSAAFMFLKDAADVSKLIKGQEALGAVTGTAYKALTRDLQAATGGQLAYREAAQAAAIGVSSGLTGGQLEGLAKGARMASTALGRDLTDSFNRLIRGVTKAEPELLDELGIVLRLKTATEDYAKSLGKTADDLTAFERSQAVAANVLGQLEEKYGKIARIMDPGAESLNRFLTSFDNILLSIKQGVTEGLAPVFNFLSRNTGTVITLFAALSAIILKSLIPDFGKYADAAKAKSFAIKRSLVEQRLEYKKLQQAAKDAAMSAEQAAQKGVQSFQNLGKFSPTEKGRSAEDFLLGKSDSKAARLNAERSINSALQQITDDHLEVQRGKFKGFTKDQILEVEKGFKARVDFIDKTEKAQLTSQQKMLLGFEKLKAGIMIRFGALGTWMVTWAGKVAVGVNAVLFAAGWIGAIIGAITLLASFGKEILNFFMPISAEAKKAEDSVNSLAESISGFNSELSKMVEVRNTVGLSLVETISQAGKAAGSADLAYQFRALQQAQKDLEAGLIDEDQFKKAESGFKTLLQTSSALIPGLEGVSAEFEKAGLSMDIAPLIKYSNAAQEAALAVDNLARGQKAAADMRRSLAGTKADPLQSLITQTSQNVQNAQIVFEAAIKTAPMEDQRDRDLISQKIKEAAQGRIGDLRSQLLDEGVSKDEEDRINKELFRLEQALTREIKGIQDRIDKRAEEGAKTAEVLENEEKALKGLMALQTEYNKNVSEASDLRLKAAKGRRLEFTIEDRINNIGLQSNALKASELEMANKILIATQNVKDSTGDAKIARQAELDILKGQEKLLKAKNRYTQEEIDLQLSVAKIQQKHDIDEIQKQEKLLQLRQQSISYLERQANLQKQMASDQQKIIELESQERMQGRQLGSSFGTYVFNRDELSEKDRIETERKLNDIKLKQAEADRTLATKKLDLEKAQFGIAQQRLMMELAVLNKKNNITDVNANGLTEAQQGLFDRINTNAQSAFEMQATSIESVFQTVARSIRAANTELDIAEQNLDTMTQLGNAVGESLENGMVSAFEGIIDGTKDVKDAFKDLATGILKEMSKVIANKLAAQIIGSMFPVSNVPVSESYLPDNFRYGGYTSGKLPQANVGGVLSGPQAGYPVMMHGTEAVVPLPNGREIPVQMKNGGGVNNVTVNVNVDNNGNATTTTEAQSSQDAGKLGQMISQAVQKELQNQKRSGGILNPYGAS